MAIYTKFALAAMSILAMTQNGVEAASATFKNQCPYEVEVYDNASPCKLAPGSMEAPTYGCDRNIGGTAMYRNGQNPEATLAEFSNSGGKSWYDISAIPPGPGDCRSYSDCAAKTGKRGFNTGMMIYPMTHKDAPGYRCEQIMCQYDGCPGAFHFPGDTNKIYSCPDDEHFSVIFCP